MGSTVSRSGVCRMANVKSADMQVPEASDEGDHAENKTNAKADEIEGVHTIWCSVLVVFRGRVARVQLATGCPRDAERGRDDREGRASR